MNGPFNPLVIAQAVARNIVPLVGILALHCLLAMPGGADNLEPDASSIAGPADRPDHQGVKGRRDA